MRIASLIPLLLAVPPVAARPAQTPPAPASSKGCGNEYICGPVDAEDLERVAGTPWVIGSAVNGGNLYLFDARNASWRALDPAADRNGGAASHRNGECPSILTEGDFAGHGIAIRQGPRPLLYAINHRRQTIEIYRISRADGHLTWSGCIPSPADMLVNGVAPLPGGGLAATKYATPGVDFVAAMAAGKPTGEVRIWRPGAGWNSIPGTSASVANGIAASPDGKTLFVTVTGTREIWRIDLRGRGATLTRARLDFSPDNLRWNGSGSLLTTGFTGSGSDAGKCWAQPGCMLGFKAVSIDPATLTSRTVAMRPAGGVFGNASALLRVGAEYWVGTFRGDRIARLRPSTHAR